MPPGLTTQQSKNSKRQADPETPNNSHVVLISNLNVLINCSVNSIAHHILIPTIVCSHSVLAPEVSINQTLFIQPVAYKGYNTMHGPLPIKCTTSRCQFWDRHSAGAIPAAN
jgi:hypothetical protein